MKTWIIKRWFALRATIWFVPTLFAAGAIALVTAVLDVDARLVRAGIPAGWLYEGTLEAAIAVPVLV
ncbi:hypothetical protein [Thioalkalivibrio sp.]|uniref:hypothetical protein n=1 Tax=Thioalkalivibrio sp. TaxID=2093813 RepID=UPI0012D5340F|nr:hypothetical protein [Thioalkalivibrio sp.]TVP77182.1 MAG: hypothetical protein EA346_13245 [Thioalkalivibrio sp.]